jgi:hypothetical protein
MVVGLRGAEAEVPKVLGVQMPAARHVRWQASQKEEEGARCQMTDIPRSRFGVVAS